MQEESRSQCTGAILHMSSEDGRRLCITGMSLVDADEEAAAAVAGVEYEPMSEEDVAERYDSDDGEYDVVGGESSRKRLVAAPAGIAVPDGEFLGPPRFAIVGNTAGFMRIAAAAEAVRESSKEIVVLYRYTRFSRTRSGRRVVEACTRTKLHRLRFAVPPAAAGDLARSLAWAGSSLGPLIYPGLFRKQLAELWTSLLLATPATTSAIPPGIGRLQVIVDVGILRREDYTVELMAYMRGELVSQVLEPWPAYYYHVVKELHLPEPVLGSRRIATGDEEEEEECSLCFELMESGLAAWPGCGHVFHGSCVQKTLERIEMCPLCRHRLSEPLVAKKH